MSVVGSVMCVCVKFGLYGVLWLLCSMLIRLIVVCVLVMKCVSVCVLSVLSLMMLIGSICRWCVCLCCCVLICICLLVLISVLMSWLLMKLVLFSSVMVW